jgi:hypothetical protein
MEQETYLESPFIIMSGQLGLSSCKANHPDVPKFQEGKAKMVLHDDVDGEPLEDEEEPLDQQRHTTRLWAFEKHDHTYD